MVGFHLLNSLSLHSCQIKFYLRKFLSCAYIIQTMCAKIQWMTIYWAIIGTHFACVSFKTRNTACSVDQIGDTHLYVCENMVWKKIVSWIFMWQHIYDYDLIFTLNTVDDQSNIYFTYQYIVHLYFSHSIIWHVIIAMSPPFNTIDKWILRCNAIHTAGEDVSNWYSKSICVYYMFTVG